MSATTPDAVTGILITPTGTPRRVHVDPFTYDDLAAVLDDTEVTALPARTGTGWVAWVPANGATNNLPDNPAATRLLHAFSDALGDDETLVGPALILGHPHHPDAHVGNAPAHVLTTLTTPVY